MHKKKEESKIVGRFKLVSDESGHDYAIPADMQKQFYDWVQATEDGFDFDGQDFEYFRINNSGWTFADPQGWK